MNLAEAIADMKVIMAGMPRGPIREIYQVLALEGLKKIHGAEPVLLAMKEWENE